MPLKKRKSSQSKLESGENCEQQLASTEVFTKSPQGAPASPALPDKKNPPGKSREDLETFIRPLPLGERPEK